MPYFLTALLLRVGFSLQAPPREDPFNILEDILYHQRYKLDRLCALDGSARVFQTLTSAHFLRTFLLIPIYKVLHTSIIASNRPLSMVFTISIWRSVT